MERKITVLECAFTSGERHTREIQATCRDDIVRKNLKIINNAWLVVKKQKFKQISTNLSLGNDFISKK